LLKAQWQEKNVLWNGEIVNLKPGEFITGRHKMADNVGMTERQVRTRLKLLEKSGFLTIRTTKRYSIITVNNWNIYQGKEISDHVNDQQATNRRPTGDHIQEGKEDKEGKEKIYIPVHEAITYLNKATEKQFRENSRKTISLIKARINDGYSLNDMQIVIDKKVKQWKHDEKMDKFLRPETLFGNKFESYLNESDKILGKNQKAIEGFLERTSK
jgi:uncharacterized phage protein (TIGR02220 family)